MLFNMLATLRGARFSKAFCLFAVSLSLSILVGSSALAFAPASAYAEEQTGEATTEDYLVKTDNGANPDNGANTSTTNTKITTTKTGDTAPVVPFAVAGIAMAAVSIVAVRKLATIGGENL